MVKDILNNNCEAECIGCSISNKEMEIPGGIIYETENFIIQQDLEVPIEGFLVIVSKKHIRSISELRMNEMVELSELIYKSRSILEKIDSLTDVTIIQEERSKHFHVWLFPRYKWIDEKFDNSLPAIREIMKYARENLKTDTQINRVLNIAKMVKDEFNKIIYI
ncbi:hypothetical protein UT300019_21730 [Clostridium sp. CTA-19]